NAERRKRKHATPGSLETAHDVLEEDEEQGDSSVFTIGKGGRVAQEADEDEPETEHRGSAQTLEQAKPQAISDYYTEEEATALFRKKKKTSRKANKRGKTSTTNDLLTDMVDTERVNSILTRATRIDAAGFEDDDDDLQRAIASVRRAEMARAAPRIVAPVEAARQEKHSESVPPEDPQHDSDLVLSSTIEFVQALKTSAASARSLPHNTVETSREHEKEMAAATAAAAATLATVAAAEATVAASEAPEEEEEEENEVQIVRNAREPLAGAATTATRKGLVSSASRPARATKPAPSAELEPPSETGDASGFEMHESSMGTGLAATLRLLQQRNMLDKLSDEQRQREEQQRSRAQWIAEHRREDMALQRELQRIRQLGKKNPTAEPAQEKSDGKRRGKPDEITQQELEELKAQEQEALDRKWAREYEERMRDYKPEVRLEYTDETGRQLTTKEAYKQLSHAFHGHYSGKNKIDKLMKKREAERRQMELAASETTHRHSEAMENAYRKRGAPGIILSSSGKPSTGSRTTAAGNPAK
ncbi:hypothetical protein LPJ61_004500, partial [Coemansia biformis]